MKTTIKISVESEDISHRRDLITHAISNVAHIGHMQSLSRNDEKGTATIILTGDEPKDAEF